MNLKKVYRLAAELENQLGIVNDIDENAELEKENENIPEPSLEASDECVDCEGDDCECEESLVDGIGKLAKEIRVSGKFSAAQKRVLISRLSKVAKKTKAAEEDEDPKINNMIDAIKGAKSVLNSVKTKKCGQAFGVTGKLDLMTVEQLVEALYKVAQGAGKK